MKKTVFDLSKKPVVLILILFGLLQAGKGQALLSSQKLINGINVFQDIHQKNKYYYGPKKLQLSVDAENKPKFQLLSMRYTGTQLTGDRAEKRFTNLLQFSLSLPPISATDLQAIRTQLALNAKAQLLPIAIQNIDVVLVSGVSTDGKTENQWRKHASTQSESNSEKGTFWTERSFVLPLNNYEAQILWDQYQNGQVAVSVNYAFYAPLLQLNEESLSVKGDSLLVKKIGQIERDTQAINEIIQADAFNITVDVAQYPEVLKQIDINENSVPPAYPSVEVKCFDFALGIRPDLAFKRVYVQGTSMNGQQVEEKIKFSSGDRDLTTQFLAFRYAVRMDLPLRYKILEYGFDGSSHESAWTLMPQFSNLIDASTLQKKNPLQQRCVDIEILNNDLGSKKITELEVHFVYSFHGKLLKQLLLFRPEGEGIQTLCLTHDKEQPLQYFITRKFTDGHQQKSPLRKMTADDYFLLKP